MPSTENPSNPSPSQAKRYWKENIRLVLILMSVWFFVSFGASIIFVETLNQFKIGGFPLGYWMGQQGSIFVYIVLILIYALRMQQLDRQFGVGEIDDEPENKTPKHEL